ncbi:UNVERIFIED_CONTAM: hypothetical protein Scaly_1056800 [Sesamum calycinum]|uniref:Endonuclease/exonuclease/phosphatase domain-containing protein n=1 Tax=Sesamum calycinum TaxID=2727403 RepID=A0AAW2QL75_9LAMI
MEDEPRKLGGVLKLNDEDNADLVILDGLLHFESDGYQLSLVGKSLSTWTYNFEDNPMTIDLNWCNCYVHVHDLPRSKLNLEIATFIGKREPGRRGEPGRGRRALLTRGNEDARKCAHGVDLIEPVPLRAMRVLCWNCQGLGPAWTVLSLLELVHLHCPDLVFLSKTKYKTRRYESIKEKLTYNGVDTASIGKSGGLLMLWRKDIDV